jgi:hypothetical protein
LRFKQVASLSVPEAGAKPSCGLQNRPGASFHFGGDRINAKLSARQHNQFPITLHRPSHHYLFLGLQPDLNA